MSLLNSTSLSAKDGIVQAAAIVVLTLLQKHLLSTRKTLADSLAPLKLDLNKLLDLYEKPQTEPLVQIALSQLFSDALSTESSTSSTIYSRLCSQQALTIIQGMLDVNKTKSDIKKIEGTNYGCPYTGYYDSPFALL